MLLSAAVVAGLVAVLSFVAGRSWATRDMQLRRAAVEETIRQATYPLTTSVVRSLARLSGAELIVLDGASHVLATTVPLPEDSQDWLSEVNEPRLDATNGTAASIQIGNRKFIQSVFRHVATSGRQQATNTQVMVLFDQRGIDAASRRAAMLPLITGLTTILLLSTVTFVVTTRIAKRIEVLQRNVETVAAGNFEASVSDRSLDELGSLGRAVDRMAGQLKGLWSEVNRQQSEKLLHQLSAGMAHQLRNTLTGARLALELHQKQNPESDEETSVALRELGSAEDYVKRLLQVGAGEQQQHDQPAQVASCLREIQASQDLMARHLGVQVEWDYHPALEQHFVADGPTLKAAI
ncbi:MAG: HAMP domain-containing protein, partial [bacterium]|nr:HAMP domain-containing protein [bacterium]